MKAEESSTPLQQLQQSRGDMGGTLRGCVSAGRELRAGAVFLVMAGGAGTAGGSLWRLLDPPAPAEATFQQ